MKNSNNAVFGMVNTFSNVVVNDDESVTFRADASTNSRQFYSNLYENGGNYEEALKKGLFAEDQSYLMITVHPYTVQIDKMWKLGSWVKTEAGALLAVGSDESAKYRAINADTDYDPGHILQYAKETWAFLRNVMELVRKGEFTKEAWNEWNEEGSPSYAVCKHCGKSFDEVQFGRNLYTYYTGVAYASLCKRCKTGVDDNSRRFYRVVKIEVAQEMVEKDGYFEQGVFVENVISTRVEIDGKFAVYKNGEVIETNTTDDSTVKDIETEYKRFSQIDDDYDDYDDDDDN